MFCLVTDLATSQDFSTARLGVSPSSRAGAGFGKSLHGSKVLLIIFGFGSVFPSCTALPSGCLFSANIPGWNWSYYKYWAQNQTQVPLEPKHLKGFPGSQWHVLAQGVEGNPIRREETDGQKCCWKQQAWEAPSGVISKFSSTGRNLELLNRKCRWCRHKSLGKSCP